MTDFAEFQQEQELAERAGRLRAELARVHQEQRELADREHRAAHRELYADVAAKMAALHDNYANRSAQGSVITPDYSVEAAEAARAARERTRQILGTNA